MILKIILMVFCFLLVAVVGNSGKPTQFAKARFATRFDKIRYCYEAKKQLREKRLDRVCLYCGSFPEWQMWGIIPALIILFTGEPPTVFIPSANTAIDIVGVAGSGKTYSAIDPACASAIEQGFPLCVYDAKGKEGGVGGQIPFLATLALRHGYQLRIFAPGREYSCVINPLDFMRDRLDIDSAKTLASNFHANLRGKEQRTDGFFAPAAAKVVYGCFVLAKNSKYPDLAMAFALMQLSDLPKRLLYAAERKVEHYSMWDRAIFSQVCNLIGADKTLAGVFSNAYDVISQFIQPDILPCLIGGTNASLRLEKKEILFWQSDTKRQTVVNPLLASIVGLSIVENFARPRKIPIVYSFDEVATFKVEGMPNWPNIFRSQGLVSIYAAQSIEQYYAMYQENNADILRNTCGTRMWFNTGSPKTSRMFSDYLGQKLIVDENKSITQSGFIKTTTKSYHKKAVDLIESQEWKGFLQGELVFQNKHMRTSKYIKHPAGNLPWRLSPLKISPSDRQREKNCQQVWLEQIVDKFTQQEIANRGKLDYELEMQKRTQYANQLFPLPPVKVTL